MDPYHHKNWAIFREEVLRLDDYTCSVCGRTAAAGIILQVHHHRYLPDYKPWDYPYEMCSAMCKGCHAAEHGIIRPRVGWEHIGWDDLGDLSGICDCCGNNIRYSFLVHHPKWGTMEVGEICCDNLTDTVLASNALESAQRYFRRRKTFASSSRWKEYKSGIHTIKQKRFYIEVLPTKEGFLMQIDGERGKRHFKDLLETKMEVFDLIESGKLVAYFRRRDNRLRAKRGYF